MILDCLRFPRFASIEPQRFSACLTKPISPTVIARRVSPVVWEFVCRFCWRPWCLQNLYRLTLSAVTGDMLRLGCFIEILPQRSSLLNHQSLLNLDIIDDRLHPVVEFRIY